MNIVIPYRKDPHNGLELKFALRSIDKYLTGHDEIYIIGDRLPDWITNVKLISVIEPEQKTSWNIMSKILASFAYAGDTVLQWQDDIFLTKPLKVSEIKYWYDGTLEQAISKSRGNYRFMVENTALKVTEDFLYFDTHTPIIYRESQFKELQNYNWKRKPCIVKTLYCYHHKSLNVEEIKDCKIHGPGNKREKIKGMFFSTTQEAIDPEMVEIFEELYPEKSKYEKA